MLNSKLATAVRVALAVGAASTFALSNTAFANEQAEDEQVERIAVTGSKIKRIAATAPTPVVVIGRVELEDAGVSNINDFLSDMPSATTGLSPETSNNTIFANGLNTTDLRGLGSSRTLVLVNGRRFIGGQPGRSAVDLNNIATSMIERIEISTGGASAVYGADAVAGVVNIITRKSFDGIEVDLATTRPEEGGGEQTFGSIVFGKEFADGGFIFNYDYADQAQMARLDKSWFADNPVGSIPNPDNRAGDDGIPARLQFVGPQHFALYDESSEFFLGGKQYTFDESLNLREFQESERLANGGGPFDSTNYYYTGEFKDGIAYGADRFFRTPLTRHTFNLAGNMAVADDHQLSFDFIYTSNEATGQSSPIFLRSSQLKIQRDNAYIKDDLAKLMDDNGVSTISMRRLSDDFGPRQYHQDRTTMRASIGLDGMINDNWSYSTYFQHGESQQDTSWFGEVITENLFNAIDAVEFNGQIVCADRDDDGKVVGAIAGCAPVNFLGKSPISAEANEYISTVGTAEMGATQTTFGLTFSGDLYELPAGFVSSAFSFEWRRESAYEEPGTGMRKGLIFGNQTAPFDAALNVKEYSTEIIVPLLADHEWAQELNLEVAYRHMDYSTTGTDSAYKVGLTYQLNDDLRFRATRAQSVRAPNLNELYSAPGTQYRSRYDQCSANTIATVADKYRENVVRNCAEAGIPADWTPSEEWLNAGSLQGQLGGNAELQNEVSNDYVVGVVYTPEAIEGFDITLDYWRFEIEDAIQFYSFSSAVSNCYRADSLDNPFCGNFTRNPETLEINSYYETSLNAAIQETSGVDIESVYKFDTDLGKVQFKVTATYLEEFQTNQTGNAIDERITTGLESRPRWRARFESSITNEDYRVALVSNYRHATVNSRDWTIDDNNYNELPSYTTFDLTGSYNLTDEVTLRLGIQNIGDRTPPRNPFTFTNSDGYYDSIGRRLTAGINIKL